MAPGCPASILDHFHCAVLHQPDIQTTGQRIAAQTTNSKTGELTACTHSAAISLKLIFGIVCWVRKDTARPESGHCLHQQQTDAKIFIAHHSSFQTALPFGLISSVTTISLSPRWRNQITKLLQISLLIYIDRPLCNSQGPDCPYDEPPDLSTVCWNSRCLEKATSQSFSPCPWNGESDRDMRWSLSLHKDFSFLPHRSTVLQKTMAQYFKNWKCCQQSQKHLCDRWE